MSFGVVHYAGVVHYSVKAFLEKNSDTIHDDLADLCGASNHALVRAFFEGGKQQGGGRAEVDPNSGECRHSGHIPSMRPSGTRLCKSRKRTVASQFTWQLSALVDMLNTTESHYVSCVKVSSRALI